MSSCCNRFLDELRLPIFSVQDANGKTIDLNKTFASSSNIVRIGKFLLVIFAISGIILDILEQDFPSFFLAYLTNWGEVIGASYLILSFLAAVGVIPVVRGEDKNSATVWAKIIWGLFAAIITVQLIIVLVYWLTVYEGDGVTYTIVFGHGLMFLAVAIDGYILNRTPMRFKQLGLIYLISVPYTIWTLIHGLATDLGNPYRVDTGTDDDALYSVINWNQRPVATFITLAILNLGAGPLFFALFWGLSLLIPNIHLPEKVTDNYEGLESNAHAVLY